MSTIANYPVPQALDGSEFFAAFKDGKQVAVPPALLDPSTAGLPGLSAYQVWLQAGNTGPVESFFNSLVTVGAIAAVAATLPDIANGGTKPPAGSGLPYLNAGALCFA